MSMGYGGKAIIYEKDDICTIYKYGVFNWNTGKDIRDINMDESISIDNTCFFEPETLIHNKKASNEKEKTVVRDVPYEQFIRNGKIVVENSQNTWKYSNGIDIVALSLIRKILISYQENGIKRNEITYFV